MVKRVFVLTVVVVFLTLITVSMSTAAMIVAPDFNLGKTFFVEPEGFDPLYNPPENTVGIPFIFTNDSASPVQFNLGPSTFMSDGIPHLWGYGFDPPYQEIGAGESLTIDVLHISSSVFFNDDYMGIGWIPGPDGVIMNVTEVSIPYLLDDSLTYWTMDGDPAFSVQIGSQVPIPGTVVLLGSALVGLIGFRRRLSQ